jgi:hypothetical protein
MGCWLTLLSSPPTATVTPSGEMDTEEAGKESGTVAETLPASSTTMALEVIAIAIALLRGLTASALGVEPRAATWSAYTKPPAAAAERAQSDVSTRDTFGNRALACRRQARGVVYGDGHHAVTRDGDGDDAVGVAFA